jgi:hypothetical protein
VRITGFADALMFSVPDLLLLQNYQDELSEEDKMCIESGRTRDAIRLSKEVVKSFKNKLGEDHPETLRSIRCNVPVDEQTGKTEWC